MLHFQIVVDGTDPGSIQMVDPNIQNLVAEVSIKEPVMYNPEGDVKIVAVDCGIKYNQIRSLCERGACVKVVPWNYKLDSSGKSSVLFSACKCITNCRFTCQTAFNLEILENDTWKTCDF